MSSLPVGPTQPITLLRQESAAMQTAATELEGQIASALIQQANLRVMAEAFDREIARLKSLEPAEQLEFDLAN